MSKEIPEVDFFLELENFKALKNIKGRLQKELVGERLLTTPAHYAYFKIAEGVIVLVLFVRFSMRGSTGLNQLKNWSTREAIGPIRNEELILIAQDLTYYGLDLYGKKESFRIAQAFVRHQIRMDSAYYVSFRFPKDMKVMADRENICNYLDILATWIN